MVIDSSTKQSNVPRDSASLNASCPDGEKADLGSALEVIPDGSKPVSSLRTIERKGAHPQSTFSASFRLLQRGTGRHPYSRRNLLAQGGFFAAPIEAPNNTRSVPSPDTPGYSSSLVWGCPSLSMGSAGRSEMDTGNFETPTTEMVAKGDLALAELANSFTADMMRMANSMVEDLRNMKLTTNLPRATLDTGIELLDSDNEADNPIADGFDFGFKLDDDPLFGDIFNTSKHCREDLQSWDSPAFAEDKIVQSWDTLALTPTPSPWIDKDAAASKSPVAGHPLPSLSSSTSIPGYPQPSPSPSPFPSPSSSPSSPSPVTSPAHGATSRATSPANGATSRVTSPAPGATSPLTSPANRATSPQTARTPPPPPPPRLRVAEPAGPPRLIRANTEPLSTRSLDVIVTSPVATDRSTSPSSMRDTWRRRSCSFASRGPLPRSASPSSADEDEERDIVPPLSNAELFSQLQGGKDEGRSGGARRRRRDSRSDGDRSSHSGSEHSSHGMSRKRYKLSSRCKMILRAWFAKNYKNPYPSIQEKEILMLQTNMESTQLNNWFTNTRKRYTVNEDGVWVKKIKKREASSSHKSGARRR
eukprot:g20405.t1